MTALGRLLVLVCLSFLALSASASAALPAWTTYHHDGARSGVDPDSNSPVPPTEVWQSAALDGSIWAEPLVYGSTVYVATENDTVYALNAATGAVVWAQHLATPVPSGQLLCGDISPTVGITSTPVIDPSTGRIFVVADTWNGSSIAHELFALNLSDGSVTIGPVAVDPPGSTPRDQLQRTSLALDAGKVIIGYGGNDGDCGNYHGWLVAVGEGGGSPPPFEVDRLPGDSQGAIWAAGNAPVIDSSGDIWIATGNGNSAGTFDYSESVIRLDLNLNPLDYWAPSDWQALDSGDNDLGSSMPLLLPNGLVFQIGKSGIGYLLSASNLGGTGVAPAFSATVCGSYGGGIYVNGVIYVACTNGMHALALNGNTFAPRAGWTVSPNAVAPPIFAGGLVWAAGSNDGVLYALDPSTGATRFSANLGGFEHFTTPSAGGGRLFVANTDRVTAFQIASPPPAAPPPPPAATATRLASSANPSRAGRRVTFTATVSPVPDGGTVSFTDGGAAIAGCTAVPVSTSSGHATCTTTYRVASRHAISASYSGDSNFGASGASLTQIVYAIAPVISHLQARAVHRKLRLSFTISQAARLTITVYRQAQGRIVRKRCRIGAKHGRTCRKLVRKARLAAFARRGRDRISPRMRPLAPGRYVLVLSAVTADGGRSRSYTVRLIVPRK